MLSSCAPLAAPQQRSFADARAPEPWRIAARISKRDHDLATFRGQARLDYQGSKQRFRSSQVVAVQAPQSIRIDVMNPFGVSYTVATDGRRLAAFDRREKVFYEGSAHADSFHRFTGVPLGAAELAALIRGLPPTIGSADGTVTKANDGWEWTRQLPGGATLDMVVDFEHLEPLRLRMRGAPGSQDVEAAFGDYRDVAGVRVPFWIYVTFADGSSLTLTYKSVQRGVALQPDAFVLERPPKARVVDIDTRRGGG
ncbi:MAG TPA: DUF4292 domain-containing protein [Candidatus Limnocylindrales bacterium]|nr:DUF4292 domain-containing protein [Candidatus Limnocylindrales bacterium]